jgi:hypothetical protein
MEVVEEIGRCNSELSAGDKSCSGAISKDAGNDEVFPIRASRVEMQRAEFNADQQNHRFWFAPTDRIRQAQPLDRGLAPHETHL